VIPRAILIGDADLRMVILNVRIINQEGLVFQRSIVRSLLGRTILRGTSNLNLIASNQTQIDGLVLGNALANEFELVEWVVAVDVLGEARGLQHEIRGLLAGRLGLVGV
jgi:hypothetical protein